MVFDGNETDRAEFIYNTKPGLKVYLKKHIPKDDTMSESDLQKIYNYLLYLRVSEQVPNKGFVNIDNGKPGGNH